MDSQLNPENLQSHCRTCLNLIKDNKCNIKELTTPLLQIFQQCTENVQSEVYPENICFECYCRLESIEEFKELCQKSNVFLRNLFKFQVDDSFLENYCTDEIHEESSKQYEAVTNESNHVFKFEEVSIFTDTPPMYSNEATQYIEKANDNIVDIEYTANCKKTKVPENKNTSDIESNDEKHSPGNAFCNEYETNDPQKNCIINDLEDILAVNHDNSGINGELSKPFECNSCERLFNDKNMFELHLKTEHGDTLIEIPCKYECGQVFRHFSTARSHYRRKHGEEKKSSVKKSRTDPNNSKQSKCDKCGRKFQSKFKFRTHVKEVHGDVPIEIPCKYGCGKIFHRSATATEHYRLKHVNPSKGIKPKKPSYQSCVCEQCGKICLNKSLLKEHSYQHVPLEETPYKCDPCNRHFRTRKDLSRHNERHHEAIKKYQCSHCGARKASRNELNIHVNFHTKEKEYPCTVCSRVFYSTQSLNCHKKSVHLIIKKYKCSHCDETFDKAKQLKKHEAQH